MKGRLILAGVAALLLVGEAGAQAPKELLRASLNSDIRSSQPGGNRDNNTDVVILHVVEGLVALNEKTVPVPMLAEAVDLSADGTTYTFRLRRGVTFHNGAPLTSAEVVWSLKRYLDPASQWRCLPDMNGTSGGVRIVEVAAPDSRTVTIRLEKPAAVFLPMLARPDCGEAAVLHPDSVGPDGAWIKPVGTGPYRLGEWKRGQSIELERFDGYAALPGGTDGYAGGKRAETARIRFIVIPDSSAAKAALLAGNLDVMSEVPSSELQDLQGRPGATVLSAPTLGMQGILLQTRDPLLKDERLRRAIALSLDAPEIVAGIVGPDAVANPSPVPVASVFHGEVQSRRPPRDIAEARRLAAQAGYKGQTIRMLTTRRYANVYDASLAVQAMAVEAGFRIELDVLDWATLIDRYSRGDYQMMSFVYSPRLDASLSFEMISGPKDTQPRKVWEDPAALDLVRRSMQVSDRGERQAIFDELQRLFIRQTPMIVLFNQPDYVAFRADLRGIRPWPSGQLRLWNVSGG